MIAIANFDDFDPLRHERVERAPQLRRDHPRHEVDALERDRAPISGEAFPAVDEHVVSPEGEVPVPRTRRLDQRSAREVEPAPDPLVPGVGEARAIPAHRWARWSAGLSAAAVRRGWRGRAAALSRSDSLITEALQMSGPEITWIPPNELRRIARRAPGMLSDPGTYGQANERRNRTE